MNKRTKLPWNYRCNLSQYRTAYAVLYFFTPHMLPPIDTSRFIGRHKTLEHIARYGKFPTMLYRTNLWTHAHRMMWMVEAVANTIRHVYPHFNTELARTMAYVHDDIEMIIGDIMYGTKLNMTKEQIKALKEKELAAVEVLAATYPKTLNGYSYADLMTRYEHLREDDLEAQVVKYIDKFDAVGESTHELLAGNTTFLSGFSTETLPPLTSLMPFFNTVYDTFPLLKPLSGIHPLFELVTLPDVTSMVTHGAPHTSESIKQNTGYRPYDTWKHIVLTYGGSFGKNMLLTRQETLP